MYQHYWNSDLYEFVTYCNYQNSVALEIQFIRNFDVLKFMTFWNSNVSASSKFDVLEFQPVGIIRILTYWNLQCIGISDISEF